MDQGWRYFERSLMLDMEDELHHEGNEGLHMAAMGVSWQAVVYGMLGLWAEGDTLTVEPRAAPADQKIVPLRIPSRPAAAHYG